MEATLTMSNVPPASHGSPQSLQIRPELLTSPAVKRLLEEIRCDGLDERAVGTKYDRTHNRHNR